ncbi:hypothetical protein QLQ12_44365 [Actinoplanes sp. NEAU-A12]|uniref:Uncharacterized protein n=1 Tax=Actinoplanes sandaracinus TaxID=3045177 RepID=A0ABT6X0W9_9ACTN|nr:hypothetical protein [Actinoplanes sandaracinus]MDI6105638.1 hypothetical protein [Actinoplanes sandaracinus]
MTGASAVPAASGDTDYPRIAWLLIRAISFGHGNGGTVRLRVVGALITGAVLLAGCGTIDGADAARDAAEVAARELNDDLGWRERVRDAEYIAASEIKTEALSSQPDSTQITVTPVAWSGRPRGGKNEVERRCHRTVACPRHGDPADRSPGMYATGPALPRR